LVAAAALAVALPQMRVLVVVEVALLMQRFILTPQAMP
jgi:hypothetical protein